MVLAARPVRKTPGPEHGTREFVVDNGVKSYHEIRGALGSGEVHDKTFGLLSSVQLRLVDRSREGRCVQRLSLRLVPLMEITYIIRVPNEREPTKS